MPLIVALLGPQLASAAARGSFSPVGSMGTARTAAAAAPLPDGRVLVAGGVNDSGVAISSAEVFNPATNSFSPVGSMESPREEAAAAPLQDGRVLIAGGSSANNGTSVVSSAEVFNPATNSFSAVGAMGAPRSNAAAAPLPDGRVLVAGGTNGSSALSGAEVFDPATNSFSSAGIGSMGTARSSLAAAPLPDGRALFAGGGSGFSFFSSAEVFNPGTGSFGPVGSMGTNRQGAAAAAPLTDGRVLVVGGFNGSSDLSSAETFDPAANSFSSVGIGSMGNPRFAPAAAALPDGRVLVAGGNFLSSAEVFTLARVSPPRVRVRGLTLIIKGAVAGTVVVSDAAAAPRADAGAARKRGPRSLKPSKGSGGGRRIVVAVRLTKSAKAKLRASGKLKIRATVSFTPKGECTSLVHFKRCYHASTHTAKLKLTG